MGILDVAHPRDRLTPSITRLVTHLLPAAMLVVGTSACAESGDGVGESEEGRLVLGSTEEREVAERGVAPGGRRLIFQGYHGDVRLEATVGRFADLEFVKIARGDDREGAQRLLEEVTVSEQGGDDEFRYVIDSPNKRRTAVDLHGYVPESASMEINWESGAISLSGPDGPLRITNGSGRVEAAGIAGDAEIRVQNGGLLLGVADLPSGATIVLETANGDINLTLPPTSSAQIAAQTAAGEIQTTGLEFTDRRLEPIGAGAEFNAQLGRGSARIRLRTENGSIHLTAGRMQRLPSADSLAAPSDTAAVPSDTTTVQHLGPPADTSSESSGTSSGTTDASSGATGTSSGSAGFSGAPRVSPEALRRSADTTRTDRDY